MLALFYVSIFEGTPVNEHSQTPIQTEPVDTSQVSNVAANNSIQGVLVQPNKVREEVYSDDDPDSKRRYVNPLASLIFLYTETYVHSSFVNMANKTKQEERQT